MANLGWSSFRADCRRRDVPGGEGLMAIPMPGPVPHSPTKEVRCPICLGFIAWDQRTIYKRDDAGHFIQAQVPQTDDDIRRREALLGAYVLCPSQSAIAHYLPLDYLRYREPLVIGLVGTGDVGKSTLLTAMVAAIERDGLRPYGYSAMPLAHESHQDFRRANVVTLIERGEVLPKTDEAQEGVQFADAFLLVKGDVVQPIAFFDVGGDSLGKLGPATQFIQALGALIFIVDPDLVLGRVEGSLDESGRPVSKGDDAFGAVLSRLLDPSQGRVDRKIPAAIVLAKGDTLRFDANIGWWLGRPESSDGKIDANLIRAESRDVYAFLHQHDAMPWLRPFDGFPLCTLHVVSATGGNRKGKAYPFGVRSRRTLEPLVAILAMAGVITGREARRVGRA
jgi:hypothetical protein